MRKVIRRVISGIVAAFSSYISWSERKVGFPDAPALLLLRGMMGLKEELVKKGVLEKEE